MELPTRLVTAQFGSAISLVWSSNKAWCLLSITLLIARAVLALATLGLLKMIIDAVVTSVASAEPSASFTTIAILVAISAAVALLTSIITTADTAVAEIQNDLIRDHIHTLVHEKAVAVDLEYYENAEYFNTLHRIQIDAPDRAANILTSLLQIGRNGFVLIAIAGMLIHFQWWIILVLLLGDLPGALVRIHSAWLQYRWEQESTPNTRRASYFSLLLSSRYPAQEVRLFDLGALFSERFSAIRVQLRNEHRQLITRRVLTDSLAQVPGAIAILIIFGFVANEAVQANITLGDLAMYFAAIQRGRGNLKDLLYGFASFYQHSLFLGELSSFLSLEQKVHDPVNPKPVPQPMQTGIFIDHLDFRYPESSDLALQNINFIARPGERIAIVGRNGSGKSTLIKLLCRLYEPSSGSILVDGTPLSDFSKQAWLKELSIFTQEHGKYYLSAHENIWFGSQNPDDKSEEVIEAAKRSGADEVIQGLHDGYNTVLGTVLEQGVELSMGEWQKIGLARTYLRNAQLVILDEPTSAMDVLSEQNALEQIWSKKDRSITILISHRLSAVRDADRIYVLADGHIVESGNHQELINLRGHYMHLFEAQSQGYQ